MMAHGHFVSGCAAGLLCAPQALPLAPDGPMTPVRAIGLAVTFSALVGVGALWPDIDHKPAFISKVLGPISWVACFVMRHLSMVIYEATRTERDRQGGCHRTFTHTLPFVVLTALSAVAVLEATPARGWAWFIGFGLGLGTLAHIGGDALTLSGVPLYWPLLDHHGRRWGTRGVPRWMRFRAGGKVGEHVATLAFTGLTAGLGLLTVAAYGAPWWTPVISLLEGS